MSNQIYVAMFSEESSFSNIAESTRVFNSHDNAVHYIYEHFINRVADMSLFDYEDLFDCEINDLVTADEKFAALSKITDCKKQIELIDSFCSFMSDDLGTTSYSIKCFPTQSFMEQAKNADAIDIDDHFIRYFNVSEDVGNADDDFIEAGDYRISFSSAENAEYDPSLSCWKVATSKIVVDIKFVSIKNIS